MAKKLVEVDVYSNFGNEQTLCVKGRFLGLIRPDEFSAILDFGAVGNKLFTKPSKDLVDLETLTGTGDLRGLRACVKVNERDGEEVPRRQILITEPLEIVNAWDESGDGAVAHTVTEDGAYIIFTEKEVD